MPVSHGDPSGVAGAPDGIILDGEWSNNGADAYPSGNGTRGGDFRFLINVLPGDADGNGTVSVGDVGLVATHFGQSGRGPREGDLTGDGLVTVADVGVVSTFFGQALPPALSESGGAASDDVLGAAATVTVPARKRQRAGAVSLLRDDGEGA